MIWPTADTSTTTYLQAFPDPNFRAFVLEQVIGDGRQETDVVTDADKTSMSLWSWVVVDNKDIADLTGLEYFTGLNGLNCADNRLTALDVSKHTDLRFLQCGNTWYENDDGTTPRNQIKQLDISKNTLLETLFAGTGELTELDVSNNPELKTLHFGGCPIKEIDLSNNPKLENLWVGWSPLNSLDISANTALKQLYCAGIGLTELDISNNPALQELHCYENYLSFDPDISLPDWRTRWSIAGTMDDGSDFQYYPQREPIRHGIDYDTVTENNITIPAVTFSFKSGKQVPADATPLSGAVINLTAETFAIPNGYNIEAYSIDGGTTWKAGSFSDKDFSKLLNKGGELWLCFKDYNSNAKKPQGSGNQHNIIAFAKINERPKKAPKLAVNYLLDADTTGETSGYWLLTAKGGTTALRGSELQIGKADTTNKKVDENGFGQFYDAPNHGIPVEEYNGSKVTKPVYLVRYAPNENTDGSFTPASKTAKIKVSSNLKTTKYVIKEKAEKTKNDVVTKPAKATIKVKANTYISINGETTLYTAKKEIDVLNVTGTIELWQGATAKKPATAKQILTV